MFSKFNIKKNITESSTMYLLYSFVISFISLFIYSQNSPLYPFNNWEDINCFFTVGRSLLHGKILYLEIFDHKGPLLYFIYELIALISEDSYLGVFLVEIIYYGLFVFFAIKCAKLYISDNTQAMLLGTIVCFVVPTSHAFSHGGSVEEMFLFTIALSLYLILKDIKNEREVNNIESFTIGACFAYTFWIKYTLIGYYLALCIFIIIYYKNTNISRTKLLKSIVMFIFGTILVTVPIIAYFIRNNCFQSLLTTYFKNNLFEYNKTYNSIYGSPSFLKIIKNIKLFFVHIIETFYENYIYSVFVILSILILKNKNFNKYSRLLIFSSLFGLLLTTYIGGQSFSYYGLTVSAYTIFGLIALQNIMKGKLTSLLLILALVLGYFTNRNTFLMKFSKEDTPQYVFAEIINKDGDKKTILNYDSLDSGFYYAAGIIPNCKYFYKPNIELSEVNLTQEEMIINKKVDYIVSTRSLDYDDYKLVKKMSFYLYENSKKEYFLYQLAIGNVD